MQNIYDNAYLTIRPIFGREIAVQVVPQPACDRLLEQQIKARLRLRKSPAAWRKNLALRLFYVHGMAMKNLQLRQFICLPHESST